MLFSSLYFLCFFLPAFFITYFLFKKRTQRNIVLLAFSLVFYAWGEPVYVFLMIFSIIINYLFGIYIDKAYQKDSAKSAKLLLVAAVVVNLGIIGFYKYADFLISIINSITGANIPYLNIPLPIGISFYTFQILSYVIDVYKKEVPPQKNILFLGTYLCGFPQLIAGPIVRYQTVADELVNRQENISDFASGLRRFTAGLMKKIFIANNMAVICDTILVGEASSYGALGMWFAVISYSLQIYYDFSGYSDMAIGIGRMMGFHYLENFNYPYIAKSVSDFWRRWHMSLSTFFRDYVYIPLGGNRVSAARLIVNTMAVWLLTGLWHGANWTFILWGVYFGILLIIEKNFFQNNILKVPVLRNVYAITAFVFGWIIFRADSVSHIGTILVSMFGANGSGSLLTLAGTGVIRPMYLIAGVAGIICCMPVSLKIKELLEKNRYSAVLIDIASVAALFYCIVILAVGSYNPFIYFRF